jgi:hypothetical protein
MVFFSATLPFHLLNWLARQVGIAYPPDLLLVLGVLFLVVLVFQLSVSLARLNDKHTALVQEFGILTAREPDKREQSPPDPAGGAVESP